MMEAALRALVRERAGRRCRYCRLHEDDDDFLAFHVEHVIARQHGGLDDPAMLCWACAECNWAQARRDYVPPLRPARILPLSTASFRSTHYLCYSLWFSRILVASEAIFG
jgi:hypothetical protein